MTALPSAVGALWHNLTGPIVATYFQSREAGEPVAAITPTKTETSPAA